MKISVIVPVYNVEEYLVKCLDSLVNQTLKEIEIIVVNDGSPDNSQAIIDKYEKKYSNLKSYKKKNGGQGDARNYGIKKAKSEYLVFVDPDDYVELDMFEKMYYYAINNNYDIVVCDAYEVYENELVYYKNYQVYTEDTRKNLLLSQPAPWGKLFKKELFNDYKFLTNVRYYEDLATIKVVGALARKVGYVSEPLYYYLIREGSTMRSNEFNNNLLDIFKVMDYLKEHLTSNFNEELEYLYIEQLLYSATLRFLNYQEGKLYLKRINKIIRTNYPNWRDNKYYKKKSLKFKLVCNLSYARLYLLLKFIKRFKK